MTCVESLEELRLSRKNCLEGDEQQHSGGVNMVQAQSGRTSACPCLLQWLVREQQGVLTLNAKAIFPSYKVVKYYVKSSSVQSLSLECEWPLGPM